MAKSKETGKPLTSIRFLLSIFILVLSGFVLFLFIYQGDNKEYIEKSSGANSIIEKPLIRTELTEKEVSKAPKSSLRVEVKKKIAYAITVTKVYRYNNVYIDIHIYICIYT